jgi:uracil-DNA glycosylase
MPRDREIAELIADVKEQVLYLQELGVEDFRVELSEPPALAGGFREAARAVEPPRLAAKDAAIHPSFSKEGNRVSPPVETPQVQKRIAAERPAGARLAALPSLSKRKPTASTDVAPGQMPSPENMTKAKTSAPSSPSRAAAEESLFGEIGPALPEAGETVEDIWAEIGNCTRCPLFEGRTQVVHTTGNYNADLMFIGEAPGADEDAKGEPFVGRAGQLLNKIIEAIGMTRDEVAIGNINRCRPPGNRAPTLPEAHTCRPFLLREIAVIRPKVIVVMGNTALHNLLDTKAGITKVRGKFQDYFGVKVMPTFHPAYLLRDPHKKRETWEDMKMVRDYLNSPGS